MIFFLYVLCVCVCVSSPFVMESGHTTRHRIHEIHTELNVHPNIYIYITYYYTFSFDPVTEKEWWKERKIIYVMPHSTIFLFFHP